jgi:thiol:disulfide interchange protein DsbC
MAGIPSLAKPMKLLKLFFVAAALAALLVPPAARAQDATEQVKADFKKKFPDVAVENVRKVPYGNLYEITAQGEVLYTDEKTSFLFLGSIVDTKTKENVTEVRTRQINAVKFDALPLDSAIKITRGNGSRRVAIFEDPNCGYCKRFEQDLLAISDITVYVFLYPILSPDSTTKSKAVWCSADRGQAWLDLMLKGKQPVPADAKCDAAPVDKNLAFGRSKRVNGTPTIFFEDGDRVGGAMTREAFDKKLASAKPEKAAAATK